jgi:hypothetical protein
MRRASRLLVMVAVLGVAVALAAPNGSIATEGSPLWIKHIQKYSGGISNGVRQMVSVDAQRVGRPSKGPAVLARKHRDDDHLRNVQMNDNSYPPLPQNETAVAYSTDDPFNAVAAANDYVSGSSGGRPTSAPGATPLSPTAPVTTPST